MSEIFTFRSEITSLTEDLPSTHRCFGVQCSTDSECSAAAPVCKESKCYVRLTTPAPEHVPFPLVPVIISVVVSLFVGGALTYVINAWRLKKKRF
jgi:hypothetical protein